MKKIKLLAISVVIMLFAAKPYAQQVNNFYFLENTPYRHLLNPAMQPLSGFYLGLPFAGYQQMGFGNNSITVSSFDGSLTLEKRLSAVKPLTLLNFETQMNILSFGFRAKNSYITFGASLKADTYMGIPKDVFNIAIEDLSQDVGGIPVLLNKSFDFSKFSLGATAYMEFALGYARNLNEKWAVGLNAKYLYGLSAARVGFNNFSIATSPGKVVLDIDGYGNYSVPDVQNFDPLALTKPSGTGAAFDLGVTYKPLSFLSFAASVTDLGFINWKSNTNNFTYDKNFTFNNIGSTGTQDFVKGIKDDAIKDTLLNNLDYFTDAGATTNNAFKTNTNARINASAEVGILKNAITFGVLSSTLFHSSNKVFQDITTSVNLRPVNWFNLALSYSLLTGRGSNIGAGIGFRLGTLNLFASADYIPINYKTYSPPLTVDVSNLPVDLSSLPTPEINRLPYKTDRFNFAVGFNVVFGNRQDSDKDGVSNRRDKCPDTPHGVIVNKKGCPLDTDGDGVYDFLDKCPDTPQAAYSTIDADGCPIDTDGDGVYDYLDKCPETVPAAYGKVDENGCPKDTDKDGIADYLDKCEGTPEGVKVDSLGCPLDEDGDNVPDYLDKCPGTPIEARGLIDSTGCPIDKDLDGVYDYLDLCPNTPAEARGNVDKNGCPKDTDLDGVADYLDKCPDTPIQAKGTVDENGCPRDTDGDGVLDYLDKCPRIAGVASNNGCPEIKKEVRQLFQKALQGIQFETAKWIIKPVSFKILDDVAKVLAENPTYLVEIQGHTDNVGKKAANQLLSENRAKAVREYLINKGIDEKRMTSNGYGDTKPVLPNTTAANKAKNRRVEFVVSFEEVKIVTEEEQLP